jgi:hypothetical protein
LPTALALTAWFRAHRADANFYRFFGTHNRERIGSPMVAGPTNRRRSFSTAGFDWLSAGRPPPLRRTRSAAAGSILGTTNDCAIATPWRGTQPPFHQIRRQPSPQPQPPTPTLIQPVLDGNIAGAIAASSIIAESYTTPRRAGIPCLRKSLDESVIPDRRLRPDCRLGYRRGGAANAPVDRQAGRAYPSNLLNCLVAIGALRIGGWFGERPRDRRTLRGDFRWRRHLRQRCQLRERSSSRYRQAVTRQG